MGRHQNRIEALDALRGFALLGILLINIQVFSGYDFLGEQGRSVLPMSAFDSRLDMFLDITVRTKFYSLFSFLFGYSFVMLAARIERAGPHHLRRMAGLVVIGLLHAMLIWPWDILLLYGLVGLALTPFLRCSVPVFVIWAGGVLVLIAAVRWFWLHAGPPAGRGPFATGIIQGSVPMFADGTYVEVVQANIRLTLAVALERLEDLRPLRVFSLFLIGAAAARLRLAESGTGNRGLLAVGMLLVLPLGLMLAAVELETGPKQGGTGAWGIVAETLAAPMVAAGYAALLLGFWRGRNFPARLTRRIFSPAGRMALTSYLTQSAICVGVFYGFGLGLFAELSLTRQILFAGVFFAAQLLFSALWLRWFRQGPAEWLWRWQIKGKRPAMRHTD